MNHFTSNMPSMVSSDRIVKFSMQSNLTIYIGRCMFHLTGSASREKMPSESNHEFLNTNVENWQNFLYNLHSTEHHFTKVAIFSKFVLLTSERHQKLVRNHLAVKDLNRWF